MASQNLNIKVKLDFDETSLKNLNLGTVRVDLDVNHFKSKLRSALNGNFKITPKINTKGISNQLNNIKNDMREFRNAAKDPIKINFVVDKDVLSDLAVVSRQLEKIHRDDYYIINWNDKSLQGVYIQRISSLNTLSSCIPLLLKSLHAII